MSEQTSIFPWPSYYGHFDFFEARMRNHSSVIAFEGGDGGIYNIQLKSVNSTRIFICECYSFGTAEYIEAIQASGHLDAIIINSAWCGYTLDAKRTARSDKVGLYKISDFMAALNKPKLWDHLNDSEKEAFRKKGWL